MYIRVILQFFEYNGAPQKCNKSFESRGNVCTPSFPRYSIFPYLKDDKEMDWNPQINIKTIFEIYKHYVSRPSVITIQNTLLILCI